MRILAVFNFLLKFNKIYGEQKKFLAGKYITILKEKILAISNDVELIVCKFLFDDFSAFCSLHIHILIFIFIKKI